MFTYKRHSIFFYFNSCYNFFPIDLSYSCWVAVEIFNLIAVVKAFDQSDSVSQTGNSHAVPVHSLKSTST